LVRNFGYEKDFDDEVRRLFEGEAVKPKKAKYSERTGRCDTTCRRFIPSSYATLIHITPRA